MLTEAELKAAVAHELGHVRQGTAWLRWLRLISTLGGHPPWFLLLPVDLRSLEEEADQFALRAGADPQALASAVIKAGNLGGSIIRKGAVLAAWLQTRVPDRALRPISSIVRSAAVVDRFLFTDYLVSSPHPAIRDRLAAILGWVPERPTSAQAGP
jgi:Zn-dependent protease with chaperone function